MPRCPWSSFAWFHIVCGRYTSDYAYFTFSDTIWPLLLSPDFGTQMITLAEIATYERSYIYLTTTYNHPSCLLARAKEIEKFVQDIPAVCARVPSPIGILRLSEYLEHALGFWLRWDYVAEMNLFLAISVLLQRSDCTPRQRNPCKPSFIWKGCFWHQYVWDRILLADRWWAYLPSSKTMSCAQCARPCKRNGLEWWERWWSTISHSSLQPLLSAASEFNCFKATLKSSSCIAVQCPYVLSVLKRP